MRVVRRYIRLLAVMGAITALVSFAADISIGFAALVLFIAWPVLGTFVTIDDDLPGGWSNPDGKSVPEWKTPLWHVDLIVCRGSIVVAAFAIQNRDNLPLTLSLSAGAVVMAGLGFPRVFAALRACDEEANHARWRA